MSPYLRRSFLQFSQILRRFSSKSTMADDMFLFWGSGSVPCWKAMIALDEKGFRGYKNKLISFDKNEQKGPDVLKFNPRGEVSYLG